MNYSFKNKLFFWFLIPAIGLLGYSLFWPDNWWPKAESSGNIPTVATKSKELTWNGYDPLVIAETIEPGEWISIRLEQFSRDKKTNVTVGTDIKNKVPLKVAIYGPRFSADEGTKRRKPFRYDTNGRKLKAFTPVVLMTADKKKWRSAPLSVMSWTQAEKFEKKVACKNIYTQTLSCILVLNAPKGRSDKLFYEQGYTMTFSVTKHVVVADSYY
jgi:hypothetical protein